MNAFSISGDLHPIPRPLRRLCIVLGDQLDRRSGLFDDFDPARDAILMTEAAEEATYIAQHKKRLVMFFSAMRHFAEDMAAAGRPVIYHRLDDPRAPTSLAEALRGALDVHAPEAAVVVRPGDWRVLQALEAAAAEGGRSLSVIEDRHFLSSPAAFDDMRRGRKRFILEDFYRAERKRTGWLMNAEGGPEGGVWNFDKENRRPFGKAGPGLLPLRLAIAPDETTTAVIAMVRERFDAAPGSLEGFDEAVTPADAERLLTDFIEHRLPMFGDFQDAIAAGHRTLYHSRISAAMNLKLLDPREACMAAIRAHADGRAPLNAVEGFVRQILGWREFVRGVYWTEMPDYAARNGLDAEAEVPAFFWTAETEMACLRQGLQGLVATGYAHHIERLMVMGLFMLLQGTHPYRAHEWHISMYLDAIDWVSLPNVLGMSQHADGGVVGTKPYAASGAYIDRMSDCCRGCRYDPKASTGDRACPFTALYWDFLARHEDRFRPNMRMKMQIKNLDRKSDAGELPEIRRTAARMRVRVDTL